MAQESSKRLRARLQRIADRLTGRRADLAKSRRRYKVWREAGEELERKALRAKNNAHVRRAERLERRARRARAKSIYWHGRIRRDKDAIASLEAIEDRLEDDLKELEKHVRFEGPNRIRGGTYEQRAKAAQARAMLNYRNGDQPGYYSMEGGPRDYAHTLYHYAHGRVWDCSTYTDGTKYVTGDPSPSGPRGFIDGGYTGTELEHCKRVRGQVACGDLVVYLRYPGDQIGHHVEVVYDPEHKLSSGHGDEAINLGCRGSWDLFGDGNYVLLRPPRHEHDSS